MTTYARCKKLIQIQKANDTLNIESFQRKLDVFLLAGSITEAEYTELIELMNA